ncbi:MAG TPA: extracellular solute-binding protein [Enterovirga sp.]|jgi:iron(III) transport system substrate-binding protein
MMSGSLAQARLWIGTIAASLCVAIAPALAQDCCPKELVDAATKEGKVVIYSGLLLESEQIFADAFMKRFPGVRVDIVRAPGGRLFTRIQSEAAANKLGADIIDMTDRGLAKQMEPLYADYAPPNAKDYDRTHAASPKFWPRAVQVYAISYNPALLSNPPTSWADLLKPEYKGKIGRVVAGSGGTTWTENMFQRKTFGLDYWKGFAAQQPRLFESNGPLATALVRGEVQVATLLVNAALPMERDGAPIKIVYPTEGLPITPESAGITKTAPNPNAAKLFMDYSMSLEGQNVMVDKLGFLSLLKGANSPKGMPAGAKTWLPDGDEYEKLRDGWIAEWNTTFNYR